MDQGMILWSYFKFKEDFFMKLILKDNTEITITRMNNTYAYENFKDGMGADMGKNTSATISIFDSEKSFDELRKLLSGDNREGFRISYGVTEKEFPTMKIESISEDISNNRSIITISLTSNGTEEPIEKETETDEKETTKEA